MRIRPFAPGDLLELAAPAGGGLQAAQSYLSPGLTPAIGEALRAGGLAFTVEDDGGRPVSSIGLVELWEGRALAWAIMSAGAGRHLLGITRAVRRFLAVSPWRRIEAGVECSFAAGHRWARVLGFKLEAERMASWSAGRDFALYARLRPESTADQEGG